MSDLVIVAYPDEATAFEVRAELMRMQKEYLIEMEDIVVVTRDETTGDVNLHQAVNLTARAAIGGGFWGALVGMLFLSPVVGAAVGAGAGALAGKATDIGINDDFMRDVGRTLEKGGSALCVLIRRMTADKVLDRLAQFRTKGRVIQTSLSKQGEAMLREILEERAAPMTVAPDQLGLSRD